MTEVLMVDIQSINWMQKVFEVRCTKISNPDSEKCLNTLSLNWVNKVFGEECFIITLKVQKQKRL